MMVREWNSIRAYEDILFDIHNGIARITINRPHVRNAFTPQTTSEISSALLACREEASIRVVIITGAGDKAFCSGGDQNVKAQADTLTATAFLALTFLMYKNKFARCPSPSSPW